MRGSYFIPKINLKKSMFQADFYIQRLVRSCAQPDRPRARRFIKYCFSLVESSEVDLIIEEKAALKLT